MTLAAMEETSRRRNSLSVLGEERTKGRQSAVAVGVWQHNNQKAQKAQDVEPPVPQSRAACMNRYLQRQLTFTGAEMLSNRHKHAIDFAMITEDVERTCT